MTTITNSKWNLQITLICTFLAWPFGAGCASAQAQSPPASWQLAESPVGISEHGKPDVALPKPKLDGATSLGQILAFADRHAPSMEVARSRLSLGAAALEGASPILPDNPQVSVGVGPGINSPNHLDFTAAVSQRLEIAGERSARLETAKRLGDRLRAELEEARWEVHRDVHAAFHRALVFRERLAAAERLLVFQERLLEITRGQLRAGDVSPLAVRLADGELSQARVSQIAATQDYRRACLELGGIAGWPVSHPPEPAGTLDLPRDPPEATTLLVTASRRQPKLRTFAARRAEAAASRTAADRDAWPEPTIGVQLNRESYAGGPPETQIMGTLSMPIPLLQRNQGARATARAEADIVEAEQRAFSSQLRNRIEQHRTAVIAAAQQVRTYGSEILPSFEENLRLIQRAFELGEIDILQVSVARERFLRIQADALDAYANYFVAVADLEGAIGADLWPDERHDHDHDHDHDHEPQSPSTEGTQP